MNKLWLAVGGLLVIALLSASGCSKGAVDPKYNFITLHHHADVSNGALNASTVSTQDGYVKVGDTRADIEAVVGATYSLNTGLWCTYEKSADGNSGNDILISVMTDQSSKTTMYGTSIDSNYTDLVPAYAKDPNVKVALDTKTKVIFSSVIDGVNYTVTYRNYPNSGDVKTITITNTARYTESDTDFPQYASN